MLTHIGHVCHVPQLLHRLDIRNGTWSRNGHHCTFVPSWPVAVVSIIRQVILAKVLAELDNAEYQHCGKHRSKYRSQKMLE